MDSDSDHEISSPNETTPSLKRSHGTKTKVEPSSLNNTDVCVGCIAAALTKHHPLNDSESSNGSVYRDDAGMNGPSSLPSTLKKYKGHHSTGSCRGIKSHHHHHSHHHQQRGAEHSPACREKCDRIATGGDYELESTSK